MRRFAPIGTSCSIFKNVKNPLWRSLQFTEACNFIKITTPSWVFFMFFRLCKWYQITRTITYIRQGRRSPGGQGCLGPPNLLTTNFFFINDNKKKLENSQF